MTAKPVESADRLVVRRLIRATRQEVFGAWTDPQGISEWMCPGGVTSAETQLDVRVGGKFRILMKEGEKEYDHTGECRVV
ncbi:MAG: SRPBCC domain-containing protein [Candidatus Acidiferrales bacterium]